VIKALNCSLSVSVLEVLVRGISSFVVDGVSTSKYSILADNTDSRPHFINVLKKSSKNFQEGPQQEVSSFTTFFIPAYIKVLIGNEITYDCSLDKNPLY